MSILLMVGLAALGLVLWLWRSRVDRARIDWRMVLSRAPLPMLALAASYGVYSFALLFVPMWVAVTQAAAFELTYLGLALAHDLSAPQRKRATAISVGAVVTSIIYNTLAGWFVRQPQLLTDASETAWLALALLHGAPLAWVAFLVADLLLHSGAQSALETLPERSVSTDAPDRVSPAALVDTAQTEALPSEALEPPLVLAFSRYACPHCNQALGSKQAVGAAVKNGYCLTCKHDRKKEA